jgi:hypothetical protein
MLIEAVKLFATWAAVTLGLFLMVWLVGLVAG